jgi:hypothetical protein
MIDFRAEAICVGQTLLERGHLECVSQPNDATFHDGNALYRLSRDSDSLFKAHGEGNIYLIIQQLSFRCVFILDLDKVSNHPDFDTVSLPSTSSTYYLDLDVSESKVQLRRPRAENFRKELKSGIPFF